MSRVSLFFLIAVTVFVITIAEASAQTNGPSVRRAEMQMRKSLRTPRKPTSCDVANELRRQQKFLRDVASRYEAVSVHDLTPFLSYSYVWRALRENRDRLIAPGSHFSLEQTRLVERGYDLLETDVLLSFVDHQMSVLNEALDLDELQYSELEKILSTDLNQKRALVSDKTLNSESFLRRLQAFSDQTERKLIAILQPEQKRAFQKHLFLNRDRLVG